MTELDAELGPAAVEVIEEFGKSVEYVLTSEAVYDPSTGHAGSGETPVPGIKIAPPEDYSANAISSSGGLVEIGDKRLTVPALYFPTPPTEQDKVSFDGVTYIVVGVTTIYSGELPCLYILQVRA